MTSSKDVYPPESTFVYFSNASNICHPHSRYLHYIIVAEITTELYYKIIIDLF